jgi:UDP-GlcNAc3NAcA epimerase
LKIITVVGARPQFIKAAVVSRALKIKGIEEMIIHTGQHFDKNMSEIFFEQMDIPEPKFNLNINSVSHGVMTGKMLERIENILKIEKPDMVLVYGDTNSTLAGALAASKLHIPLAHIEAGLRSFNMKMPEEINRILTDRVSNILFCPTANAITNLENEGYNKFDVKIVNTGDVMYDAAVYYSNKKFEKEFDSLTGIEPGKFVLATLHREENVKDEKRLTSIIEALNEIHYYNCPVVAPLHPGTVKRIKELKTEINFKVIEPVSYLEMIFLIKSCKLVITDSGGLQKEAFFFKKFCLTTRDQTEWVELTDNKVNFLVSADKDKIIERFGTSINLDFPGNLLLYGQGNAGDIIADELFLNGTFTP